jgi:hypothetical protein
MPVADQPSAPCEKLDWLKHEPWCPARILLKGANPERGDVAQAALALLLDLRKLVGVEEVANHVECQLIAADPLQLGVYGFGSVQGGINGENDHPVGSRRRQLLGLRT